MHFLQSLVNHHQLIRNQRLTLLQNLQKITMNMALLTLVIPIENNADDFDLGKIIDEIDSPPKPQ